MAVSVAIIVKNEARVLGRCLESLSGAVDEIVVVDTGSSDATKEIARGHGATVYDFPWIDDFSAARQFAFDHATSDWVFWVDAVDVVLNSERIRLLAEEAAAEVTGFYWRYVLSRDEAGRPTFEFWRERLVRNDGSFHWVGRVHEVLAPRRTVEWVHSQDVIVEHHPEPSSQSDQPGRNLRILEAEYEERQGDLEPRQLFYLGREYADHGQTERALAVLEQYLTIGTWADERYAALIRIAELHRAEQRYERALDANLAALKIYPRWPDAYFGLARTYYYLENWPHVIHWTDLGRVLPPPETLLFVNPADYHYAWMIYYTNALYRTGELRAALDWTKRALELDPGNTWHQTNLSYFKRLARAPHVALNRSQVPVYPTYAVIPVRDRHELTRSLIAQLDLPAERVIIVDNGSTIPARDVFSNSARVVEHSTRNISALWNVGLDAVAAEQIGPYNVAVLNNDLSLPPGFLTGLANGLRARPTHLIAYPDHEHRLPPGICDSVGRMSGFAFMLRGEFGLRLDPQFVWWFGDDDLERRARAVGEVVCVGGVHLDLLESNLSTSTDPDLGVLTLQDQARYEAKWG
ncbi:MAG: glycosyltransferase [Chloroflexota bacterium]|nr:glycosyltransferase [Chloroflexota bacterium]